ncbi:hypothetical protein [Microbacterium phyllosphaerae]|uniref:hypothetical protein n=1 Tax=Microbacterium phyllosphaerae TaxID=124798 RepID=UPI002168DC3A|nr:hypothetical protein [Microbacterium phyllosphaerae]MCS3442150.1 multidrug efflux pump subunit AcrA (membrane-fusion protein) [Microbacterium phyllosphaerae]
MALVPDEIVWTPVERASGITSRSIEISLAWDGGSEVVAPSWSGVVQATYVSEGQTISSGDSVALIDGITRMAWAFEVPLYRDLEMGDTGADAAAANKMLEARGYEHGQGAEFNSASVRGAVALAKTLGIDTRDVASLSPSWFLYLPKDGQAVTENALVAGAPAPSLGAVVLMLAPSIKTAKLPSGEALLPEDSLVVGGETLTLAPGTDTIDQSGLDFISSISKTDAESVFGTIQSAADGAWVVPTAAVIIDKTGVTCVLADSGPGTSQPVPVTLRGSQDGAVVVDGRLNKRDQVGVGARGASRSCG